MEQSLVQILVVVANIQMRTLKTKVEKGSAITVFGGGLVDPKTQGKSVERTGIYFVLWLVSAAVMLQMLVAG